MDGYNVNVMPHGIIDDKLFLTIYYTEEDIDYLDFDEKDWPSLTVRYNCYINLETGEMVKVDLYEPAIVTKGYYYYNKKYEDGIYKFTARDWIEGTEKVIYDGPVDNNVTLVDGKLFFNPVEGIDELGNLIRRYDKDGHIVFSDEEYYYDLHTGKTQKIDIKLPDGVNLSIIAVYKDYYIVYYMDIYNNVFNRLAYISKEDYYNGMEGYVLIDLPK